MRTAILIDGGFFIKRYQRLLRRSRTPKEAADDLHKMCLAHLRPRTPQERSHSYLYRIFYYDCPPLTKKAHNPVTGKSIDFNTTRLATWRLGFFEELKKHRKVALRLGYLNDQFGWTLHPKALTGLLNKNIKLDELTDKDVKYEVRQKGVDMRLGLDIASLAYKRQVEQIVLVSGDSDFVPAAKLARREGIDFVLDPMWAPIRADLHEHVDGLRSVLGRGGQIGPN